MAKSHKVAWGYHRKPANANRRHGHRAKARRHAKKAFGYRCKAARPASQAR